MNLVILSKQYYYLKNYLQIIREYYMCVFTQFIAFVFSEVQHAFCLIYIKTCLVMSATTETLVCKHKCTSNVWNYFRFIPKSDNGNRPKDPNKAICKIYFKETGLLPKPVHIANSNTSNLFSHLRVHHMEVYSQLKAAMEKPKMDSFVKINIYFYGSSKWEELMDA